MTPSNLLGMRHMGRPFLLDLLAADLTACLLLVGVPCVLRATDCPTHRSRGGDSNPRAGLWTHRRSPMLRCAETAEQVGPRSWTSIRRRPRSADGTARIRRRI